MQPFRQVDAVAAPLPATNIDTDQVIPARYLQKPRSTDFGQYLFQDVRRMPDGSPRGEFALNRPAYADARIIVAGRNFGCGSSREQAVWALVDSGIRAVIAPSFGDIFRSNALKNGLLPVMLDDEAVDDLIAALSRRPGERVRIDLERQTVTADGVATARFEIDPFPRHCLLNGLDEIDYTLGQIGMVEAYEKANAA